MQPVRTLVFKLTFFTLAAPYVRVLVLKSCRLQADADLQDRRRLPREIAAWCRLAQNG